MKKLIIRKLSLSHALGTPLVLLLGRHSQADLCELEDSLVYRVSSKTARATEKSCLENKNEKQNNTHPRPAKTKQNKTKTKTQRKKPPQSWNTKDNIKCSSTSLSLHLILIPLFCLCPRSAEQHL